MRAKLRPRPDSSTESILSGAERARNDKRERKFYDFIPPLLEKKYLKTIIKCHECANTLSSSDLDHWIRQAHHKDGEITVLDIDFILH